MTNAVAEAQPQATVEVELTSEVLITRYLELREELAKTEARHKTELEPIKEEMKLIELYTKNQMNEQGTSQIGVTGVGTAFFQTKDTLTIENYDQAMEHVKTNGLWQFLKRDFSKNAVKEYIEQNGGVAPPGVKLDVWREVQFRKSK